MTPQGRVVLVFTFDEKLKKQLQNKFYRIRIKDSRRMAHQ
jgi:hypothetical protein